MKNILFVFISYILLSCGQFYHSSIIKGSSPQDSLIVTEVENDTCCINRLVLLHGDHSEVLLEIHCEDGSSIDFMENINGKNKQEKIGVYAIYNAAADGNNFFFFNYLTRRAYITPACFSDCRPEYASIDFERKNIILRNINSSFGSLKDTLNIGERQEYIVCGKKFLFVKAKLNIIY